MGQNKKITDPGLQTQSTDNKRVYVFDLSGSAYGYYSNHIWRSDRQIKEIIIKKGKSDPNKQKMQQNSIDYTNLLTVGFFLYSC